MTQDAMNTVEARRVIDADLARLSAHRPVISFSTARVIAASLHEGPTTALHQLAGNGSADRDLILRELAQRRDFPIWRDALRQFVQQ